MMFKSKAGVLRIIMILALIGVALPFATSKAASPIRVACIGDSITEGAQATDYAYWGYVGQLSRLLGSTNYTVNNYGISGTTMLKKGSKPYWNQQYFTDSQNWLPNIVTIQLGTNDDLPSNWVYKSDFLSNYVEMINIYKNLSSHPTVYVCLPPTIYDTGSLAARLSYSNSLLTNEIIPLIKQAAASTGAILIDNNTPTQNMIQNFPDGIHPNNTGHGVLANTVYLKLVGAPTPTPTPTRRVNTPTRRGAPTPTPTPNRMNTPTPGTGTIKVQFYNQNTAGATNQLYLNFQLVNTGSSAITLSNVKIRYWYTEDGAQAQTFYCDYSPVGSGNVTGNFVKMGTVRTGADTYVEIGFTSGAGSLAAGASTVIQSRVVKSDWSNYTQTNDYSFNSSATSYVDWTKTTGYVSGSLKWGTEP